MLEAVRRDLQERIGRFRNSCDRFLIVDAGSYYLQMMFNVDGIYGEAVSNTFLEGDVSLTAADVLRLLDLGWTEPDRVCHPWCAVPHPNFHRVWPGTAPTEQVVEDLLRTLAAVYLRWEGQAVTVYDHKRSSAPSKVGPPSH